MFTRFVERIGILHATLFTTGISIFVSVIITASAISWQKLPNMDFIIIIAIICPLVIASPLSYFWFQLFKKYNDDKIELQKLNQRLALSLNEVKELSGLLPICSSCKKIRDDKGYWNQLESYIRKNSKADFSHGICPDCAEELYPQIYSKIQ